MHQYTLRFHNESLENAYLEYQNKSSIQNINVIVRLNYPLLTLLAVVCGYMKDYVILSQTIAYFLSNIWFQRNMSSFTQRQVLMAYEIMIFTNPSGALVAVYFSVYPKELALCLAIYLILEVQMLVITSNILLATAQLLNHLIGISMMIFISYGQSVYSLVWIPYFLYCIYNYQKQKRNQRLLFQQSQVNYSIFTLMKETAADDIIYFKLNKELLKYELETTNIDNFDLSTFLSSFIVDQKQNLKQYLFSKSNINNLILVKHKISGYINLKSKMELEVYIQYYPDLQFFIRIIKQHQQPIQRETQLMYKLYKRIILKAQSKPTAINFQYIVKQLTFLNARIQLGRIIQTPQYFVLQIEEFNILTILKEQLDNIQCKYLLKADNRDHLNINSNKIIFEILIHSLCRIIKQYNKFVQLTANYQDNDKIIIIFNFPRPMIRIKESVLLKKFNFLQNLLSDKKLVIEDHQILCFIDVNKNRPLDENEPKYCILYYVNPIFFNQNHCFNMSQFYQMIWQDHLREINQRSILRLPRLRLYTE